jgi:MOSC domain-containing protein YiiM
MGQVVSVNVGTIREILHRGRVRTTAIWKEPVAGRLAVLRESVSGDHQADPRYHGGPQKAVYAYAAEDYRWWEEALGRPLSPGTFGENLTLSGVALNDVLIGERLRFGTAVLEATQPRFPCWKLGHRMGSPRFPRRFLEEGRAGAYFAVVEQGDVGAGDAVEPVSRPGHPVTLGLIARLNHADVNLARLMLEAVRADLSPEDWQELMALARMGARPQPA